MTVWRLAHLSDPHLGPLPAVPVASLLSKRAFGYINWVRNRASALSAPIVDALVEDLRAQAPDHIAVTGDLVNIALPAEYERGRAFLAALGEPSDVTVVPGNHDAYVPGALDHALRAWAPYLRSDDGSLAFPLVRRRGAVLVVGLSTARATPPAFATGTVGKHQRERAAALLDRHDDALKVCLIHHPPDPSLAAGRRRLTDHDAVRRLMEAGAVDLVLHGHTHVPSRLSWSTPTGPCAVVGVPSASSDGSRHPPAGYNIFAIDTERQVITLTRRTLCEDGRMRRTQTTELPS